MQVRSAIAPCCASQAVKIGTATRSMSAAAATVAIAAIVVPFRRNVIRRPTANAVTSGSPTDSE